MTSPYHETLLTEYRLIRTKLEADSDLFYRLIQNGCTIVIAFASLGVSFWKRETVLVLAVFGFFIPTLCYMFIVLLIGQIQRIKLGAEYCLIIESSLNQYLNSYLSTARVKLEGLKSAFSSMRLEHNHPIGWESWLHGANSFADKRSIWIYTTGIGFFSLSAWMSVSLYIYYLAAITPLYGYSGRAWALVRTALVALPPLITLYQTSNWVNRIAILATPRKLPLPFLFIFLFGRVIPMLFSIPSFIYTRLTSRSSGRE